MPSCENLHIRLRYSLEIFVAGSRSVSTATISIPGSQSVELSVGVISFAVVVSATLSSVLLTGPVLLVSQNESSTTSSSVASVGDGSIQLVVIPLVLGDGPVSSSAVSLVSDNLGLFDDGSTLVNSPLVDNHLRFSMNNNAGSSVMGTSTVVNGASDLDDLLLGNDVFMPSAVMNSSSPDVGVVTVIRTLVRDMGRPS